MKPLAIIQKVGTVKQNESRDTTYPFKIAAVPNLYTNLLIPCTGTVLFLINLYVQFYKDKHSSECENNFRDKPVKIDKYLNLKGGIFMYDIQHCFICQPSDSTVSEDAGIEPMTVAILV